MRTRLTLALGCVTTVLFALALGGRASEADAVSRPPKPELKRQLPTRTFFTSEAAALEPSALPLVSVEVALSRQSTDAILPPSLLMPEWDPELAWPLPEDLSDDPVIFALQDVMATASDTEQFAETLDELDVALIDSPVPSDATDPWAFVARLEAERQLARADYHDDLLDHDQRLIEWSDGGGHGERPDTPAAWQADGLASDAMALAESIDAHADNPEAADIARLTAASVYLDWESGSFNETLGSAAVLDVIHHSSDPAMLAAAIDLLVGTTVELPDSTLAELSLLSDELPAPTATRLAWFLAGRQLDAGRPEDALKSLDAGIAASTTYTANTLDTVWARSALEAGRGSLLGMTGRVGGRSLPESVQAAAWQCWGVLMEAGDAWVTDGTAYELRAVVGPDGVQWLDSTDQNAHGSCLTAESQNFIRPDQPVQLLIQIEPVQH